MMNLACICVRQRKSFTYKMVVSKDLNTDWKTAMTPLQLGK